jgi:very-long-chain enoyl-CoA reductase
MTRRRSTQLDALSPKGTATAALAAAAAAAAALVAPSPALAAATTAATTTPAGFLFIPPWTPLHIALLAVASLNLLAGLSEGKGQNTTYSKFSPTQQQQQSANTAASSSPTLSSRDGMAVIYGGGLLVSALAPVVLPGAFGLPPGSSFGAAALLTSPAARPFLVAALLALHFLKREAEVFFLHKYSGGMPTSTALMISAVYTATALQYLYFTHVAAESGFFASSAPSATAAVAGVLLFVVGQAGNFYHHWLLARLRSSGGGDDDAGKKNDGDSSSSNKKRKAYAVPQGGLFPLVACPHYLFEIVAWLGLAVATQTVVPLVSCAGMASYLAGRSAATRRWNRANLPGYPRARGRLVPFLW